MRSWLYHLTTECLRERHFSPLLVISGSMPPGNGEAHPVADMQTDTTENRPLDNLPVEGFKGSFSHSSCPRAQFEITWLKAAEEDGRVTGTCQWTLEHHCDDSHTDGNVDPAGGEQHGPVVVACRLDKLDPSQRSHLKCHIIDNLLLPCLYSCQHSIYGSARDGLIALPPEILRRILSFLSVTALCSAAVTHPVINAVSRDRSLWKALFKRDFPMNRLSPSLCGPNKKVPTNWRELYKMEYLANRAVSQRRPAVSPLASGVRPYLGFYKSDRREVIDLVAIPFRRLVHG